MNPKIKRYLISAALSFASGFCIALLSLIDTFTVDSLSDGTFAAALFVATRTGLKLVFELTVALLKNLGYGAAN